MSTTIEVLLVILLGVLVVLLLQLREGQSRLRDEVRYDIPPSLRARITGSIVAIVRGSSETGVAFFISPRVALTVAHNLLLASSPTSVMRRVNCVRPGVRPSIGEATFAFDVVAHDTKLDFAVLRLRAGERASAHYLPVHSAEDALGDNSVFLVTCNIRLAHEAPDITCVSVTIRRAHVTNVHEHHVLYDAQAFDGDSGGALIIGRSGEVIGLHKEAVNAARELIEQKEALDERLDSVELSVKALVQGTAYGCIGVRVDSNTARDLISAAE